MSWVDKLQVILTWVAVVAGLAAFGGGIALSFCRSTARDLSAPDGPVADVVPFPARLRAIEGGLDELGGQVGAAIFDWATSDPEVEARRAAEVRRRIGSGWHAEDFEMVDGAA